MSHDPTLPIGGLSARRGCLEEAAASYLAHVVDGHSIRSIAARAAVAPSTILRRIRKIESMRDDPVLDSFLTKGEARRGAMLDAPEPQAKSAPKPAPAPPSKPGPAPATAGSAGHGPSADAKGAAMSREEVTLLRRLSEANAMLVVSRGMEKAIVLRTGADGTQRQTGVVSSDLAGACVLRDWIRCARQGKVSCYHITDAGRMALRRTLAGEAISKRRPTGFSEAPSVFGEQHKDWGERAIPNGEGGTTRTRVNLRESPLAMLGRKRGKDGKPFLSRDLVDAGERLREDFELSRLGPRVGQNWDRFLTAGTRGQFNAQAPETGLSGAQARFDRAMGVLGPGLSDVAMRCCCFLEGLETAEKRLGWSARSGKIVLRIALQRLRLHYDTECGGDDRRIG